MFFWLKGCARLFLFVIHLKLNFPLLPGSFLKFWGLGALGNCLTRLMEGPALPQLLNYILKKRLKILLTSLLMIGLRSIWLNLGHIEKLWFLLFYFIFLKDYGIHFCIFPPSKINSGE